MTIRERDVSVTLRNMWHQKSSTELVMALASTGGHSEWCYMRCWQVWWFMFGLLIRVFFTWCLYSLTHSLTRLHSTHSLTHSHAHPLTHALTDILTRSHYTHTLTLTHSHSYSLTHSLTRIPFACSLALNHSHSTRSIAFSLTHSFDLAHSHSQSITHSYSYSLVPSQSLDDNLTHSHLLTHFSFSHSVKFSITHISMRISLLVCMFTSYMYVCTSMCMVCMCICVWCLCSHVYAYLCAHGVRVCMCMWMRYTK